MATIIQVRRDTSSNWSTVNPILAEGEMGYELDTAKLKIGDGVSTWNALSYFIDLDINHNDLQGFQGGSATQRYHLTEAQHAASTQTADNSRNGLLSAADWMTFNGKQNALGYTPENSANKENITLDTSTIKYPTNNLVKSNLDLKEPVIVAGTTAQYLRGDKTWQTLNKTVVGLSNVTNDAQLLRAAGDINSFTTKTSPVSADVVLIEDSADTFTKKKILVSSLPISTATQSAIDTKVTGPASSTDNAVARYDGISGKLLQVSSVTIADNGNIVTDGSIQSTSTSYPNVLLNSANRMAFGETYPPPNDIGTVISFASGSSSRNMLFTVGKTGVNTSFFGNNGSAFILGEEGANPIIFKNGLIYTSADVLASGTEWLRIAGNGNVGIGTTTPASKLHLVGGNLQIGTSATVGHVLTANAQGVATWQPAAVGTPQTMYLQSQNLGQVNSTTGVFYKAETRTDNQQAGAITNPQEYRNRSTAPFLIPCDANVIQISIASAAMAVSQATAGTSPKVRITFYTHTGTTRTSVGTYDVPVSPAASVGVYNNLSGGTVISGVLTIPTPLALAAGTLLGWEFINRSTDNNMINGISATLLTVTLERV